MKTNYITIAVIVFAALSLGVFFWQKNNGEKNQVQGEQTTHAEGEDNSGKSGEKAEHKEEGEEGHEDVVRLSDAELREFGIRLETAQGGALNQYIELPGEIVLNTDRMAHVVPRVAGIVREVRATVGDQVKKGQLLAVLESRGLADAKASYLAAVERESLAQANFKREERLWQKKVTSEQEYLNARQAQAEARIAKNSAEQQLHALGCNGKDLLALTSSNHASFTHYTITSPFAGTVIEKHITFGEQVGADADVFTIADLSTVWVNINIYQKDLVSIRKGQTVGIEIGHGIASVEGKIAWVGPQVDEGTRTATARIELPNPNGSLRPGLFVTAKVAVGGSQAGLVVPKSALQTFEGKTVVFVRTGEGLEPKPVELGRETGTTVEILSGLVAGQTYAAEGSFTLKAQLSKGAFGDGHNH